MSTQKISVTMPSEIILVTGTVNGVAKDWSRVGDSWQCIAERSADDVYLLSLTATNSLGVSVSYELTLYYGILSLITDRTQADVDRAAFLAGIAWEDMTDDERAEFAGNLKGFYNASDMNRVDAAVGYLRDRLLGQGYSPRVTTQTDRTAEGLPAEPDFVTYLANVRNLRSQLAVKPTTPALPAAMRHLGYEGANAIEQVLKDLDELLTNAALAWHYSGEIYSGEV